MNWPIYADYAYQTDYAEYADHAEYAEYAEYAEFAEYAEYAKYAKYFPPFSSPFFISYIKISWSPKSNVSIQSRRPV